MNESKAKVLNSFLQTNPDCEDLAIPLWAISKGLRNSIWASVRVRFSKELSALLPAPASSLERNKCVDSISRLINIAEFDISSFKATKAVENLFW
jgi:hypothetical protein